MAESKGIARCAAAASLQSSDAIQNAVEWRNAKRPTSNSESQRATPRSCGVGRMRPPSRPLLASLLAAGWARVEQRSTRERRERRIEREDHQAAVHRQEGRRCTDLAKWNRHDGGASPQAALGPGADGFDGRDGERLMAGAERRSSEHDRQTISKPWQTAPLAESSRIRLSCAARDRGRRSALADAPRRRVRIECARSKSDLSAPA